MSAALLTIKNLSAWYNDEKIILSDFSLELAEHEVAGLIGLNGAGKTTFLKVLSGLHPTFHADRICFCGSTVNFRKQDFKLCRYTVFAEDNSFSYLYPFLSLRSGTKRYENVFLSLFFLYNSSCRELGILQITGR